MATHAGGLIVPRTAPGFEPGTHAHPDGARGADGVCGASAAVQVDELVRRFGDRVVLDRLDLTVAPGEFVALLGRSGSGKSTLLRALAALDVDAMADGGAGGGGTIQVPARRSVLFQDSRLLPWERVMGNVILGLRGADARVKGRAALQEMGMAGREMAWPRELSDGEQQCVALARSLVRDPELLLADEPFGALDSLTRIRMHQLLRRLRQRHRPAVLLVTHDVDEAITLADRVLVLGHGRIDLAVPVDLDEPRHSDDPRFVALRFSLLLALGVRDAPGLGTAAAAPDSGLEITHEQIRIGDTMTTGGNK